MAICIEQFILWSVMEETKNTLELNTEEGSLKEEDRLAGEDQPLLEETAFTSEEEEMLRSMMEIGVFYGRSKTRTNPLMKKYVLATRAGFEVIDLKETIVALERAADVIKGVAHGDKGPILLVGTSPAAKAVVKDAAEKLNLPAVTERWLGGTLTNFKIILERIKQFRKLKADIASGKFEKYTKKERLELDRSLARLEILFGGIEKLDRLPSLILITDLAHNTLAAREAKRTGIPVAAFVNTDADPRLADYVIPANDKSSKSIKFLLDCLGRAIEQAGIASNIGTSDIPNPPAGRQVLPST